MSTLCLLSLSTIFSRSRIQENRTFQRIKGCSLLPPLPKLIQISWFNMDLCSNSMRVLNEAIYQIRSFFLFSYIFIQIRIETKLVPNNVFFLKKCYSYFLKPYLLTGYNRNLSYFYAHENR